MPQIISFNKCKDQKSKDSFLNVVLLSIVCVHADNETFFYKTRTAKHKSKKKLAGSISRNYVDCMRARASFLVGKGQTL